MKKYIIFSCNCEGLGGGKIYVKNKILFLQEKGWDVELFPWRQFSDENVVIPELKGFEIYKKYAYELSVPPHYLSKTKRKKIVREISEELKGNYTEFFVESNSKSIAYWGELLAEALRCPHLCFVFSENYVQVMDYDFYEFKLRRHELAGINRKSLPALFRNWRTLEEEEKYVLKAPCHGEIADIDVPILSGETKFDFVLATIGRLEKKYVPIMFDGVYEFCDRHKDMSFELIIIGDTVNSHVKEKLDAYIKNAPSNLIVRQLGFMSPLPKVIFEITDLLIATAGSANVGARHHTLTISMDVEDGKPIGLLGYTTTNAMFRDKNEQEVNLPDWIERVLIRKEFSDKTFYLPSRMADNKLMEQHFEFMEDAVAPGEYYNFENAKIYGGRVRKIFCRIFGYKSYIWICKHFLGK